MTSTINRGELKAVVRELMQEVLWELEQQMPDPDTGETLRPEIAEHLRQAAEHKEPYHSLNDVKRELGLDE
jgi:hypothetical protein